MGGKGSSALRVGTYTYAVGMSMLIESNGSASGPTLVVNAVEATC